MSDRDDIAVYLSEADSHIRSAETILKRLEGLAASEARQLYTTKYIAAMKHLARLIAAHHAPDTVEPVVVPPAAKVKWKPPHLWAIARQAFSPFHSRMDEDHECEIAAADIIDACDEPYYCQVARYSDGEAAGIGDRETR